MRFALTKLDRVRDSLLEGGHHTVVFVDDGGHIFQSLLLHQQLAMMADGRSAVLALIDPAPQDVQLQEQSGSSQAFGQSVTLK